MRTELERMNMIKTRCMKTSKEEEEEGEEVPLLPPFPRNSDLHCH